MSPDGENAIYQLTVKEKSKECFSLWKLFA